MPRGIVERRIHRDDIGAVGRQTGRGQDTGGRRHIQHPDVRRDRIGGGVTVCKSGKSCIDLDQHELDRGHSLCDRKAGGADAGAEINHAIARACRRRRRQQQRIVAGAVA